MLRQQNCSFFCVQMESDGQYSSQGYMQSISQRDCPQSHEVTLKVISLLLSQSNLYKHTLFLKKNMTAHGSYNSYIALKSGTSVISTRYMTAKFFILSATDANTSSICMHVSSQSCPKRITTTLDSSCKGTTRAMGCHQNLVSQ